MQAKGSSLLLLEYQAKKSFTCTTVYKKHKSRIGRKKLATVTTRRLSDGVLRAARKNWSHGSFSLHPHYTKKRKFDLGFKLHLQGCLKSQFSKIGYLCSGSLTSTSPPTSILAPATAM